ncbi:MAG: cupin domain-containing protein [Chloroflexi bacterium]|nr:cupin domain-containing protein [Chloroflexota bacterium]
MRRILTVIALASSAVLLAVEPASATPGVGLTRTVLAQATVDPFHVDSDEIQMHAKDRADIVTQQVEVAVGGDTGWHTHFGPAFVLVKSGSFSLTHADGCETTTYQAGEGFVERPNDVHIGRNAGTTPVEIIATYTNVPIGGQVAVSVAAPADCQ